MGEEKVVEVLKHRKVVWREEDNGEVKVAKGTVKVREDNFIIIETQEGEVWVNKSHVIAIKDV